MKSTTRRNGASTKSATSTSGKARWLPNDTTRPVTFPDRRAVSRKNACRGKVDY